MRPTTPSRTLLRAALQIDAVATGATGALLLLGAGALAGPLGLPEPLLRGTGAGLLPFAAVVARVATRAVVPRGAAAAIAALNALWVVASIALVIAMPPTALGAAFVLAQAVAVLAFAAAQRLGLRRVPTAAPAT